MIGAIVYRLGAFLASFLPTGFAEAVTEFILKPQYYFRIRSRRNVHRNLRIIMGPSVADNEIRRLARRTFSNFARSIYYFLRVPSMSRGELTTRVDSNGIEAILGELQNGCVIVGPHLGPWELGGARLASLGLRPRTVALPHPFESITKFFDEQRRKVGMESTPIGSSARSLRKALHSGEGVVLLIDRAYGDASEETVWFGRDIILPIGHVALAVHARVPIVTCCCVFTDDGNFKMVWKGPYHPDPSDTYNVSVRKLRDVCLRDMEEFIRAYPDQWFNFFPFGTAFNVHRHR